MKHQCNFCNNYFSTKTNLNNHQRKAKYCLKLQGSSRLKDASIICDACGKVSTSKWNHQLHAEKCKKSSRIFTLIDSNDKLKRKNEDLNVSVKMLSKQVDDKNNTIKELKTQIQILQDKLENIAIKAVQRPTTTNNMNKTQINNFIRNMQPITTDHLIDHAPNLTIEHVQKGASGYAEYALEYPLKDRVACVDYARRKIKFKDNEGKLVTDPEMVRLAPMFFESIKKKSSELVYKMNKEDMDSAMFEEVAKLFNTNADVKNGSSGVKSDFYHDFVKYVCSGSVIE